MLCPICKKNKTYRKERKIKKGYTEVDDFGRYRFYQTGWDVVVDEWWSCKKCANLPTDQYNQFLIDNFDKIFPKSSFLLR
jgi:hypothetical protein